MADHTPSAIFLSAEDMLVRSISISNFRNITALKTDFAEGVNVFFGDNGSGKTNLLEAIFTMCLGRSQRGAADAVLLKQEADVYRLEGSLASNASDATVAVAYQRGGRRRITINSVPAKASELYEQVSVVASGPEDSNILSGPPSTRRLFLDIYLAQLNQTYLADLSDYQKTLSQKNAALKNEMDPTPFEPLLINFGTRVIRQRALFLDTIRQTAAKYHRSISGGEELDILYQPSVNCSSTCPETDEIADAFEQAMVQRAEAERAVRTTLVGPHRDEVLFSISGLPARSHGSQGQWRTAAMSLKLAVLEMLREKRSGHPILLLDEVFAELDQGRIDHLVENLFQSGQIFLTTAVAPPASLMSEARRFKISDGSLEGVN